MLERPLSHYLTSPLTSSLLLPSSLSKSSLQQLSLLLFTHYYDRHCFDHCNKTTIELFQASHLIHIHCKSCWRRIQCAAPLIRHITIFCVSIHSFIHSFIHLIYYFWHLFTIHFYLLMGSFSYLFLGYFYKMY